MLSRSISTKWIVDIMKRQICEGKEPHIDLQMSNLKPKICRWLHAAWRQVQGMEEMIIKGWQKIGIMNAFTLEFQVVVMEANALIPFLTFTPKVVEFNDGTENNHEDLIHSSIAMIENCL
jgi:hypothetical protein